MFYLSSMRRARLYASGPIPKELLTDELKINRLLSQWLPAASEDIEDELRRELEIRSRTKYWEVDYHSTNFFVDAYPIVSTTSMYQDSSGLWNGSECELDDDAWHENADSNGYALRWAFDWVETKGLRSIYTGGLAYDAVSGTYVLSTVSAPADIAAGQYVFSANGRATGIVVSWDSVTSTLVVESYYGSFVQGDSLSIYDDEDKTTLKSTATLLTMSQGSLMDIAPKIVLATEAHLRYLFDHSVDFEKAGAQKEGHTVRKASEYPAMLAEVKRMLRSYKNIIV